MREANSGPFVSAGTFSWSNRRTSNTTTSGGQNMFLAGYGSAAELGTRVRYVASLGRPSRVTQIALAALRVDGSINAPPLFDEGSIPKFTLYGSPDYRVGPYEVLGEWSLTREETSGALFVRNLIKDPVLIAAEYDFAMVIEVLGAAPGASQSYVAALNLESAEY